MTITLTERTMQELAQVMKEQSLTKDNCVLRMRVTGGGCSGFQYKMHLETDEPSDKDVVEDHGEVRVAIDSRSRLYIQGTVVDFVEDLNKRGFVFNNPSTKSTCGCGSSFNL